MNRLYLAVIVVGLLCLCGCRDVHRSFCEQAVSKLCDRCAQCGDYKSCGLMRAADRSACVDALESVCAAYDSAYSAEVARSCLNQLDTLTCDTLKSSGKPEVCTRLF